ncbi:THO complex subunit 2 [Cadophora gregata]|uniref:THO complex subunit 2 n=1 Tax=Cadophora gregata TaxID=51156 RepID=UPI0026DA98C7|nr:THO complex subunit 2 [Cadophora gregata]KAK0111523.1 THO complex subunit 2 [Cadophora gregata]KAK0112001.1 THO complex subunit 2 [Cadophora gregata f. sp. sojae]
MAPPGKRKRPERSSVDSGEGRPSPHRPQGTNLAQHDRGSEMRDGGRRSSRGGQGGTGGGRGGRRNDPRDFSNKLNIAGAGRSTPTPGPMSPPPPRPVSAAPTPTATQTSTPTTETPTTFPRPDPAPFDYTFLTEERLAAWDTSRQEVTSAGRQAIQDEDTTDLSSIFQELIRATVDGRMDPTVAGNCVKSILELDFTSSDETTRVFNAPVLFLDILSMMLEDGTKTPALTPFVIATEISPDLMRLNFDNDALEALGLTKDTFKRMAVRKATNQLYRQGNYNLLREETEGYSKLVTELFTTSGSEPPSGEVVEEAFERVKGLIGTFDLDVGRVLDITLDVFAAVLIKHFRFFIKLLRVSSWWPRHGEIDGDRHSGLPNWALPSSQGWTTTPEEEEISKQQRMARDILFWDRARVVGLDAFFEVGGRRAVDDETKQQCLDSSASGDTEFDADSEWIKHTGTLPPSGNRVAAQLLGFKLRFYTSEARDDEDTLPANLIYLTALLIKIGFISLRDLYPHLWPLDEDMPAVRETRQQELAEKEKLSRPGGGATNALTMAGALTDDDPKNGGRTREAASSKSDPAAKPTTEPQEKDKAKEPQDQKVQLLVCLLTIGAIPESLFMLGRFPWLPEAYPELIPLINRILHHSIKDLYDDVKPVAANPEDVECPTKRVAEADQSGVPKGQVRLAQLPVKKQLRWPFPDKHDTNDSTSYRFYWDEWADDVPVCRNVDDLFTLCSTLLNLSGVNIGKDANLLSKIARIGIDSLRTDRSKDNYDRWQDLLKRLLVPALSLTNANSAVVSEIWGILKLFPVAVRYSIYAEWFEGQISRVPAIKAAFARTKLETLSTMKRISKINVSPMARALAKIAYSSPGIVFGIALSQIESYNNLTEVVVECAKHFTSLGYDVLVWSLMSALGGKDRNRTNAEFALLPSRWLLALSRFSGKVYKRYSILNLSPILRYVADQLYRGNSTDLVILKELIAQMSGIVPDTDFTNAQIHAMTGGEELRKHTLITLYDKRFESTKTSQRLMRALTESNLSGELLISIAQHRQAAIYKISDADAHIKLLATMMDDTQEALSQYLELLRSNLSVEEFDRQVPEIPELLKDFGLDPGLAFFIGRPSLAYRRSNAASPILNGTTNTLPDVPVTPTTLADTEGDISMADVKPLSADGGEADTSSLVNGTLEEDVQMADLKEETPPSPNSDPFHKILEPIIETVQTVLPEGSFRSLSPELYVTFWASALGDLAIPNSSYESEISRLVVEISEVAKDRTDMSRAGVAAKEVKKKNLSSTRDKLIAEFKEALNNFSQKKTRLLKTKSLWFSKTLNPNFAMEAFLEKCLLPRLLLSPSDSEYCFKMVKFLHENGVPYFRTLALYSQIFRPNRLRAIIFACTVREAENLGRFLRLVLMDLSRWHADSAVFEKEAWGAGGNLPGFAKALDDKGKPKGLVAHAGDNGFKSLLLRWHTALNTAIRDCLAGIEWMHIRNAITVLKSVVEVFPAINFHGTKILEQLEVIASREKGTREDLSLTGNAVLVQLKKREPKWVMVQAFGHVGSMAHAANDSANASQDSGKAAAKSLLKPTAPEFKPGSRASSQGVSTPRTSVPAEVEDGEVDDAKTSRGVTKSSDSTENARDTKRLPPSAALESKKIDVLAERDRFKAAKALQSTPANVPSRPDIGRNTPSTSVLDRGSPNLPSRPDAPFPSRDLLDRHSRHGDRRDGRDSRLQDPRLDRPSGRPGDRPIERPGDRPRDFPGADRRAPEPASREFGRSSDRAPGPDRERIRPDPPPRWTADSARDKIERTAREREVDSGRLSREMPPPRPSGQLSDRAPAASSEKLPTANPERQEIINPERAALISADKNSSRSNSPRRGREEPRDRVSSRPQSPRRHGADKDLSDARRDDRQSRNVPESYNSSRGRVEDAQQPPAGPRSDRPMDRERGGPHDRPAYQQNQPPLRSVDPDHGRLNAVTRPQPDPNFGRLSAPAQDIPSGPRDRNGRGNRMGNAPMPPHQNARSGDLPRPPTPEKQPPTGPSGGRHPRRSASGQFDSTPAASGSNATPATPVTPSPASTIHPDRLKQLGGPIPQPLAQSQAASQPAAPIHPDRLRAFGSDDTIKPQPQSQMNMNNNNNRSRPNVPPLATSGPPSGPRGSQASPIHAGPNGFAAPTGPASATERAARGGRRQLAGINTMLQQAGQQNTPDRINVRGRGRMSSGMGPETPNSGPPTPSLPIPPPPPGPPPARQETARDSGRDLINPARVDLITGSEAPNEERDRDRSGRRERSSKSRRNSRSPGRERESKRGAPEDDRSQRSDYRDRSDRRANERTEPEKDRHQSKSSPAPSRDLMASRESTGGREGGRDRERGDRERDGSRRDGREHTIRDPNSSWTGERGAERGHERGDRGNERGGSSRSIRDTRSSGDLRGSGEERRDGRGSREDGGGSGRKRRSDEGGMESRSGHDKRVRR